MVLLRLRLVIMTRVQREVTDGGVRAVEPFGVDQETHTW